MKYIEYVLKYACTAIYLSVLKVFGMNISFSLTTWISRKATLKTKNNGEIVLGGVVSICPNVELSANGGKIVFEGNNYVNRNSMIQSHSRVTIGKGTTIGPNVLIYDHDHNISDSIFDFIMADVYIGKNVWIGAGTIILKGVHIGDNAVVAAGTLVVHDVPTNSIFYQKRENTYRDRILRKK